MSKLSGVKISDTAATIQSNLSTLQTNNSHISTITPSSAMTLSQFNADSGIMSKLSGVKISDTAANIQSNLSSLQTNNSHISTITPSDAMTLSQFNADSGIMSKLSGVTISDTAANIQSNLSALQTNNSHISTITPSDAMTLSQFNADSGIMSKLSGVTISDTAANIQSNLSALQANISHIGTITPSTPVTLTAAQATVDSGVLAKLSGVKISDTATNIQNNLDSLNSNISHIGTITPNDGAVVTFSAAQIETDHAVANLLGASHVSVVDSSTNFMSHLPQLESNFTSIGSISFSDNPKSLSFTGDQFAADSNLISKLPAGIQIQVDGHLRETTTATTSHLTAIDGYVADATVTDTTTGSVIGTTNSTGQVIDQSGNVVNTAVYGKDTITISGGTDTFTGQKIVGELVTHADYTVATPITTLMASGVDQNTIANALGITNLNGVNLANFDPFAALTGSNAALGQQVFTAQQQLFTIEQTLATITGSTAAAQTLLQSALTGPTAVSLTGSLSSNLATIAHSTVSAAVSQSITDPALAAAQVNAITSVVDSINSSINSAYSSLSPAQLASIDTSSVAAKVAGLSQSAMTAVNSIHASTDTTSINSVVSVNAASLQSVICFAKGTHIETDKGPKLVEELQVNDMVLTVEGRYEPVIWIGSRRVIAQFQGNKEKAYPVRIVKDAFGENLPQRDLLVSPDHSIYVDGLMIPAEKLINSKTIIQEKWSQVTYFHVELPKHEAIYAEGLPAESYLDTTETNRAFFNQVQGDGKVFNAGEEMPAPKDVPMWRHIWDTQGYGKLTTSGPVLESVKARLNNRADEMTQKVSRAA
jgi:hypothetical protein